jgi:heme/copper-type cytochrome/quinol oxidase subunit 2
MEEVQQVYVKTEDNRVMGVKDWVITLIITALPLIGIVMLFVWAFGSDTNLNKQNWAKATLLIGVIIGVISLILFFLFMGVLFSGGSELSNSFKEFENMK